MWFMVLNVFTEQRHLSLWSTSAIPGVQSRSTMNLSSYCCIKHYYYHRISQNMKCMHRLSFPEIDDWKKHPVQCSEAYLTAPPAPPLAKCSKIASKLSLKCSFTMFFSNLQHTYQHDCAVHVNPESAKFLKVTLKWSGWLSDSYCTSPTLHPPIPSHCAVIILFKSVPVNQLSWLAL